MDDRQDRLPRERTGWPWDDERYVLAPAVGGPDVEEPVRPAPVAQVPPVPSGEPAVDGVAPEPSVGFDPLDLLLGELRLPDGVAAEVASATPDPRPVRPVRARRVSRRGAAEHETVPSFASAYWADLALEPHDPAAVEIGPDPAAAIGESSGGRRRLRQRRRQRRAVALGVVGLLLVGAGLAWRHLRGDSPTSGAPASSTVTSTLDIDQTSSRLSDVRCTAAGAVSTFEASDGKGRTITASLDAAGSGSVVVESGPTRLAAGLSGGTALQATVTPQGVSGRGDFVRLDDEGRPTGDQQLGSFELRCP